MPKKEIYLDLKPGAKHGLTLKDNSDGLVMIADAKDAAKVKARMMPTVVEAKKTWSDPPVDEKEVDEWGEVEDEEY